VRIPLGLAILGLSTALAGCASKPLHDIRSDSRGPDEFLVEPVKPLTAPKDYDVLPAPTPGGTNLVDLNPKADAVVALGGRESALNPGGGVPSSDGALVASASRYGVPPNTRTVLAEEDAEFRRKQGRMTAIKLFPVDRYSQVYRRQTMDASDVNAAFRSSGFGTPSAPPAE
jgi:hypothetical protein